MSLLMFDDMALACGVLWLTLCFVEAVCVFVFKFRTWNMPRNQNKWFVGVSDLCTHSYHRVRASLSSRQRSNGGIKLRRPP